MVQTGPSGMYVATAAGQAGSAAESVCESMATYGSSGSDDDNGNSAALSAATFASTRLGSDLQRLRPDMSQPQEHTGTAVPCADADPGHPVRQRRGRVSNLHKLRAALHGCNDEPSVQAALRAVAPGCRPSQATLTKLISKYSKTGSWRRGLAVFRHVHLLGVQADRSLANAALWACSRGGDAAEAWNVFHRMLGLPEPPDAITYRALFPVLAANQMWEQCVLAYTVAFGDGVSLDGPACLSMLCALRRAGHWQLAEASLLTELCRHHTLAASFQLFTELPASHQNEALQWPVARPSGFRDANLRAISARDLLQGVRETVSALNPGAPARGRAQDMHSDGGPASLYSVAAGDALGSEDSRRSTSGGRGSGGVAGLEADALVTPCCNVLLQAYAEATPPQPERALPFLCAMASASEAAPRGPLQPDVLSYGLVALAHCRAGLVAQALDILSAFAQTGLPPTAAAYAPCVAAVAAAGDETGVFAVWRHMAVLGVTPGDACMVAFIGAASRSRHQGLWLEGLSTVLALPVATSDSPRVQRDTARLLVSLARHSTPPLAVAWIQRILAFGIPVPPACITECVRALEWRDTLCCAALRQTAAAAGFCCTGSVGLAACSM